MLLGRWAVLLVVAALVSCGDNRIGATDGGAADSSLGADADGSLKGIDAPAADAGVDAMPVCGDGHRDPGEECDRPIVGLSGDGCSSTCTNELVTTWTNLTPNPGPKRWRQAMAYDTVRHRVVLFGGYAGDTPSSETWEWDGTTWTRILTLVAPPGRTLPAMVFDSARQRVVMFGGDGVSGTLGDTWEWDGITWTERVISPSPPPGECFMAYDPVRQMTVLLSLWFLETWEYDGSTWTKKTTSAPSPMSFTDLVYAGASGVMLIGGHQNFFWDGSAWTGVSFSAQVPWLGGPVYAAYDDINDRVLAVGDAGSNRYGFEVWEWTNGDWIVRREPTQAGGPLQTLVPDVVFDRDRGVLTLFGGTSSVFLNAQTWDWDGSHWREHYNSVPPPRDLPQMAYDARGARLVMFGGNGRGLLLGDTWEWDGATWIDRTTTGGPPPRFRGSMAYDERRGVVVLYGGGGQSFDPTGASQLTALADTWEWDGASWQQRASAISPGSSSENTMTFDRAHGYILLFNGKTWTWTGTGSGWHQLATVHEPSAAIGLAYDARRAVAVLYTRRWDATNSVTVTNLWEWDGLDWNDRGTAPVGDQLLYDPVVARSVLFHWDFYAPQSTMWTWDGTSWASTAIDTRAMGITKVFDRATRSWFSFGDTSGWDTWLGQLDASVPRETCDGNDADNDGLTRCADPDCWWRCTPLCAPSELGCDPNAPRCGDGTCSSIEDTALCPADCP